MVVFYISQYARCCQWKGNTTILLKPCGSVHKQSDPRNLTQVLGVCGDFSAGIITPCCGCRETFIMFERILMCMTNAQEAINELRDDINARIKGIDDMMHKEYITPEQFVRLSAVKGELERFVDAYPELQQ
jgi:hypothetical protein